MDTIESGKSTEVTINAQKDGAWADLKLEYSWGLGGTLFSVRTSSYRAKNNGRSKGNIKLKLISTGSSGNTGWVEFTGNGIQNGEWHSFIKTLSVDAKTGVELHFNWIYDQAFPSGDINMTGAAMSSYPS